MVKTFLAAGFAVLLFVSPVSGNEAYLEDGTYEGQHSFVTVEVDILDGRIEDIRMISHGGGGQRYADMVEPLIGAMIEKQSTDVDVVTGATVSSDNLKRAVEDALGKAKQ